MASSSSTCSCMNFQRIAPIYSDGYGDYNLNSLSNHDNISLSKDLLFPKEESLTSSSTSTSSVVDDGYSQPRSMDRNSSASLILSSLINQQMHAQKLLAQPMQQSSPKRPKEKRSFRSMWRPAHSSSGVPRTHGAQTDSSCCGLTAEAIATRCYWTQSHASDCRFKPSCPAASAHCASPRPC